MTASGDHDGRTVSVGGRTGRNNRRIGVGGIAFAVAMIGLTYAAAPFYSAFCRATGYEGTPQQVKANTDAEGHRILRVGFDANVAPGLAWRLEPEDESIHVRTAKTVTVYFRVRNLSDSPTEGHATFNVAPEVSGQYFNKISCFCFSTQHLGPHESAEWPVVFFLDPALEKDPSMARVDSITLSYTMFAPPAEKPTADRGGPRDDDKQEKTMTDAAVPDRPGFHLVEPSAWPIVGAAFAFLSAFGLILFMHGSSFGPGLLTIGIAGILFTMAGWWRDVVSEAQGGYHNIIVRHGLTFGMILFIASEVMFFVAWFWAFFWSSLNPADPQTYGLLDFSGGVWPPKGTEVLDPLKLPLMNTFVLLTSSAAVNVAHDDLREGDRRRFQAFLALGIALGVLFVCTQAYEYIHAPFSFKNSVYGATFFMATGFHGAHVIIGVIFLFVCLVRALIGQFTPRHHVGFQFAAWYWHFVDVVWLFLFSCIYIWGSWGASIEGVAR